jgi:hypothetical protein
LSVTRIKSTEEKYIMIGYSHNEQGGDKSVWRNDTYTILQLKADFERVPIWLSGRPGEERVMSM